MLSALLFFPSGAFAAKAKAADLPPRYQHWLKAEVTYLISDEERNNFLALSTDHDRDAFIQSFWMIRNPDPTSPSNTFREEHYRRLEYANSHYGTHNGDGWGSDRGMVYITLGAPQQKQLYLNTKYLLPMEIWFFQDPAKALDPYFSVLFFKPSPAEDFRIYSPYQDRPEKLIASTNAVNNEQIALKIIKDQLSDEVANLTLSLLPNEKVDSKEAYPSLQSDVLLNRIRNYRNLPENKNILASRRALLEGVTHRVLLGQDFSDLAVLATRDGADQASIHYILRLLNPTDFVLGKDAALRVYYSLSVEAQLMDKDGKQIYSDKQDLHEFLTSEQIAQLQTRPMAISGRLAASPGRYQLRIDVTNLVTRQSFSQTRGVLVPAFGENLGMSQVVFADMASPQQDAAKTEPFSFSGVRIPVAGADNATLTAGDPVRVVYQLWERPDSPPWMKGKTIQVSYLIGQLGVSGRKEQLQTVDRGSFDPQGNLLMGTDIPTTELHAGNYRLVIRATDTESNETASQAINFRLAGDTRQPPWIILSPSYSTAPDSAINLYRRGLCAMAQQQPQAAIAYLKQAVEVGTPDASFYSALASAYRLAGNASAASATEKHRDEVFTRPGAAAASN